MIIKESTNGRMRRIILSCYEAWDCGDKETAHKQFELFSKYIKKVYKVMIDKFQCNPDRDLVGDIILDMWAKVANKHNRFDPTVSTNCSGWVGGHIHFHWKNYQRKYLKRMKSAETQENEESGEENPIFGHIPKNPYWYRDYIPLYRKLNKDERKTLKSMIRKEKSGVRAERNGWSNSKQSIIDNQLRDKLSQMLAR